MLYWLLATIAISFNCKSGFILSPGHTFKYLRGLSIICFVLINIQFSCSTHSNSLSVSRAIPTLVVIKQNYRIVFASIKHSTVLVSKLTLCNVLGDPLIQTKPSPKRGLNPNQIINPLYLKPKPAKNKYELTSASTLTSSSNSGNPGTRSRNGVRS